MEIYTKKVRQTQTKDRRQRQTIDNYLDHRFRQLKYRCNCSTCPDYKYYGGRGIQVKFKTTKSFIIWVKYVLGFDTLEKLKGLEIDRINNDGHYEPGNIRFVTRTENNRNKRNSKKTHCPHCGKSIV